MKIKITADTTNIGKGTIFDIIFYSFFALLFYGFTVEYFLNGEIVMMLVTLVVGILDTIILVSNVKKRKSLRANK